MKEENLDHVFVIIAEKWVNFFKVPNKLTKKEMDTVMEFAKWADSFVNGDWDRKEVHE